jgi:cytochrome c
MNKCLIVAAAWIVLFGDVAGAQQSQYPDLKTFPQGKQVQTVSYCKGVYSVTLRDGNSFKSPEFNLRFKTDGSALGPRPGVPVILPSGMSGDRGFIIFANPSEISTFIKLEC